ncbi:MAG TPA: hypothetical protein VMV00_02600 [Candidatus Baltobacteraceae bacterium]|nr:hypothetical protein [Candidatus Baltobacteraceae bacterium]
MLKGMGQEADAASVVPHTAVSDGSYDTGKLLRYAKKLSLDDDVAADARRIMGLALGYDSTRKLEFLGLGAVTSATERKFSMDRNLGNLRTVEEMAMVSGMDPNYATFAIIRNAAASITNLGIVDSVSVSGATYAKRWINILAKKLARGMLPKATTNLEEGIVIRANGFLEKVERLPVYDGSPLMLASAAVILTSGKITAGMVSHSAAGCMSEESIRSYVQSVQLMIEVRGVSMALDGGASVPRRGPFAGSRNYELGRERMVEIGSEVKADDEVMKIAMRLSKEMEDTRWNTGAPLVYESIALLYLAGQIRFAELKDQQYRALLPVDKMVSSEAFKQAVGAFERNGLSSKFIHTAAAKTIEHFGITFAKRPTVGDVFKVQARDIAEKLGLGDEVTALANIALDEDVKKRSAQDGKNTSKVIGALLFAAEEKGVVPNWKNATEISLRTRAMAGAHARKFKDMNLE